MSGRMVSVLWLAVCSIAYAYAQNDASDKSRYELNLGVSAYKAANYEEAIEHFGNAVRLDPDLTVARLYLATAYRGQYVPGVDEPENVKMATNAIEQYAEVLKRKPDSVDALKGIGWLYMQMHKFSDAKEYYLRVLALDGNDPELYYSVAVMDWSEVYRSLFEERARMNLKSSKTLIFDSACRAIRSKNMPLVEEGIAMLTKAITLREDYDDAMVYLNLLYRNRADLECGDAEARKADLRKADEWSNLAMDVRKKKAEDAKKTNSPSGLIVDRP
jgi:tetratricopeptide (TPR) repeat protein